MTTSEGVIAFTFSFTAIAADGAQYTSSGMSFMLIWVSPGVRQQAGAKKAQLLALHLECAQDWGMVELYGKALPAFAFCGRSPHQMRAD